jgi:hypothetical protein
MVSRLVARYIRRQGDCLSGTGGYFSAVDLEPVLVLEGDPLPIPEPRFPGWFGPLVSIIQIYPSRGDYVRSCDRDARNHACQFAFP